MQKRSRKSVKTKGNLKRKKKKISLKIGFFNRFFSLMNGLHDLVNEETVVLTFSLSQTEIIKKNKDTKRKKKKFALHHHYHPWMNDKRVGELRSSQFPATASTHWQIFSRLDFRYAGRLSSRCSALPLFYPVIRKFPSSHFRDSFLRLKSNSTVKDARDCENRLLCFFFFFSERWRGK